jgi:hypothetical protein
LRPPASSADHVKPNTGLLLNAIAEDRQGEMALYEPALVYEIFLKLTPA